MVSLTWPTGPHIAHRASHSPQGLTGSHMPYFIIVTAMMRAKAQRLSMTFAGTSRRRFGAGGSAGGVSSAAPGAAGGYAAGGLSSAAPGAAGGSAGGLSSTAPGAAGGSAGGLSSAALGAALGGLWRPSSSSAKVLPKKRARVAGDSYSRHSCRPVLSNPDPLTPKIETQRSVSPGFKAPQCKLSYKGVAS